MKKLPINIQHFPTLIEEDYLYVDKTELIYNLIKESRGAFLSRPRRFGKSLLLSTLAALFSGKREFFKNLWIDKSDYLWESHPVIQLDLSRLIGESLESLKRTLHQLLKEVAENQQVELIEGVHPAESFSQLILQLAKKGKVVILIDEYDYPLVNELENMEILERNRKLLKEFFIVIKALSEHIRFAFITGVSKFSKVSLFSGMNNLEDISLDSSFSELIGITRQELDIFYSDWIDAVAVKRNQSVDELQQLMRKWYNGYRFGRKPTVEKVYNPLSLHMFLKRAEISNFWFSTATPTFAIKLIQKQNQPVTLFEEGIHIGIEIEERHDTDRIDLIPLLFQTGYLTITDFQEDQQQYLLNFPNREVKISFYDHLLHAFTQLDDTQLQTHFQRMKLSIIKHHFDDFFTILNDLLSLIPHAIHIPLEGYYHSLIFLILRVLGFRLESEVMTHRGRLDLVLLHNNDCILFEFKINGTADDALKQIIDREYHKKYTVDGKKVQAVGVSFNTKTRSASDWKTKEFNKKTGDPS